MYLNASQLQKHLEINQLMDHGFKNTWGLYEFLKNRGRCKTIVKLQIMSLLIVRKVWVDESEQKEDILLFWTEIRISFAKHGICPKINCNQHQKICLLCQSKSLEHHTAFRQVPKYEHCTPKSNSFFLALFQLEANKVLSFAVLTLCLSIL